MSYLPVEVVNRALYYLDKDTKSLLSCLLVNRHWSECVVTILWSCPFKYLRQPPLSASLIQTYLNCLDPCERAILVYSQMIKCDNVDNNNFTRLITTSSTTPAITGRTFYNYTIFLKEIIFSNIYLSCVAWLSSRYVANINNANISISTKYKGLLITRELCKAFIKNSTHINKLHINTESHEFTVSSDDYFDIPCFHGANKSLAYLQEFKCCGHYDKTKIFRIMSESCKNIQTLDVDYFLDNRKSAAADELALLIRNQKSLKSFTLATFHKFLLKIVSALSSQSKYLSHVEFKGIRFEKGMTFDSLVACKNLEVLKFNLCDYVTNHSIDSLSKTKFPKLHTLVFNVLHTLPSLLKDLIRNNHDSIKHLSLDWSLISIEDGYYDYEEESKIIEVIAKYCSNIQVLCAHLNTSQTVAIFAHCKQLENITILGREPIVADDLLPDLGFWMPTKLKTLNIQAIWSFSPTSLQQFLEILGLSECYCLNDWHLKILMIHSTKSSLKKLKLARLNKITKEALDLATNFVELVN
nr:3568_t:CDS:2 [Entrophospora candida]CAG8592655.1 13533_t:CDS:2 [Entrophospora candida]